MAVGSILAVAFGSAPRTRLALQRGSPVLSCASSRLAFHAFLVAWIRLRRCHWCFRGAFVASCPRAAFVLPSISCLYVDPRTFRPHRRRAFRASRRRSSVASLPVFRLPRPPRPFSTSLRPLFLRRAPSRTFRATSPPSPRLFETHLVVFRSRAAEPSRAGARRKASDRAMMGTRTRLGLTPSLNPRPLVCSRGGRSGGGGDGAGTQPPRKRPGWDPANATHASKQVVSGSIHETRRPVRAGGSSADDALSWSVEARADPSIERGSTATKFREGVGCETSWHRESCLASRYVDEVQAEPRLVDRTARLDHAFSSIAPTGSVGVHGVRRPPFRSAGDLSRPFIRPWGLAPHPMYVRGACHLLPRASQGERPRSSALSPATPALFLLHPTGASNGRKQARPGSLSVCIGFHRPFLTPLILSCWIGSVSTGPSPRDLSFRPGLGKGRNPPEACRNVPM